MFRLILRDDATLAELRLTFGGQLLVLGVGRVARELRFGLREQLFLSWAGLRGAVPIVLATFALSAGVGASETIFNAVFFIVVVSALFQGMTLEPLARRLGLATEPRREEDLKGLVWGTAEVDVEEEKRDRPWWQRPPVLAVIVLAIAVILNIIFI